MREIETNIVPIIFHFIQLDKMQRKIFTIHRWKFIRDSKFNMILSFFYLTDCSIGVNSILNHLYSENLALIEKLCFFQLCNEPNEYQDVLFFFQNYINILKTIIRTTWIYLTLMKTTLGINFLCFWRRIGYEFSFMFKQLNFRK